MDPLPDMVPISELRLRQNDLLAKVSAKPIVLTQHGRAVAVLLGPEPYNRLLEHIEDLQLAIEAVEARRDQGPLTDFDEYLADRGDRVPASPQK